MNRFCRNISIITIVLLIFIFSIQELRENVLELLRKWEIRNQVKIGISGHLTKSGGTIKVSIFKSPRYHSGDTNFQNLVKGISYNDLTPNIYSFNIFSVDSNISLNSVQCNIVILYKQHWQTGYYLSVKWVGLVLWLERILLVHSCSW